MRVWIGLIAALLLAGCGGVMGALEYADLAQDAQGRNAPVAELANTSFASLPDTGSVSCTGHASLAYSTSVVEVILLGNASVTADFGSDAISGQADHFFGGTGISDVQDYAGALTFDGTIGVRRPNIFDAVIDGAISVGGQSFALSGPLLGDFRGTGGQAISAITNQGLEATLNGETVMVRVKVTAEQVP